MKSINREIGETMERRPVGSWKGTIWQRLAQDRYIWKQHAKAFVQNTGHYGCTMMNDNGSRSYLYTTPILVYNYSHAGIRHHKLPTNINRFRFGCFCVSIFGLLNNHTAFMSKWKFTCWISEIARRQCGRHRTPLDGNVDRFVASRKT